MNERRIVFIAVMVLAAGYIGLFVTRGWIPHDEGLLGQSAERVLSGELPHRDFDDPYTGGGAYLKGLDVRLAHETGMPIVTADRPLHSVVLGSGACLEEFDVLHVVLQSSGRA